MAFREVGRFAEVLEPFCNGGKTEVALINAVQLYCYEESKVMKAFPQMLKVRFLIDRASFMAYRRVLFFIGAVQQGLYF